MHLGEKWCWASRGVKSRHQFVELIQNYNGFGSAHPQNIRNYNGLGGDMFKNTRQTLFFNNYRQGREGVHLGEKGCTWARRRVKSRHQFVEFIRNYNGFGSVHPQNIRNYNGFEVTCSKTPEKHWFLNNYRPGREGVHLGEKGCTWARRGAGREGGSNQGINLLN